MLESRVQLLKRVERLRWQAGLRYLPDCDGVMRQLPRFDGWGDE